MKHFLATIVFSMFSFNLQAKIAFCKEIQIKHGFVQFIQIDNSDEFQLVQQSKFLHKLVSNSQEPAQTEVFFEVGSQKNSFIFQQDCNDPDILNEVELDVF